MDDIAVSLCNLSTLVHKLVWRAQLVFECVLQLLEEVGMVSEGEGSFMTFLCTNKQYFFLTDVARW